MSVFHMDGCTVHLPIDNQEERTSQPRRTEERKLQGNTVCFDFISKHCIPIYHSALKIYLVLINFISIYRPFGFHSSTKIGKIRGNYNTLEPIHNF